MLSPETGAGLAVRRPGLRRPEGLGGGEEGGVGVGEIPTALHLAALEVTIEVAGPAEVLVHLTPVVHGDLGVVAHPGPLGGGGGEGGRGLRVEDPLVLLHVDEAQDAGAEQDREDGEPISSLAVGGVDVT